MRRKYTTYDGNNSTIKYLEISLKEMFRNYLKKKNETLLRSIQEDKKDITCF